MEPFFSIIIPTYNRADLIPKAIQSVINQTYNNWELIIVDDGSTDNTREIVEGYNDKRIRYIYQENQERCAARNHGIKISRGKYLCFLDSDDYFLSNRLELLHKTLQELSKPITFLYTGLCYDNKGIITEIKQKTLSEYPNKYDFVMLSHITCGQICTSREILLKNKFDTNFYIGEDSELWLRIISEYNFTFIENQNTVVLIDHVDRSINVSLNNVYDETLKTFKFVRKKFKYPFSKVTIKSMKSDCYFGIAKYYIYNKNRFKVIFNLILSLIYINKYKQIKYRLNIIICVIFNFTKALTLIK